MILINSHHMRDASYFPIVQQKIMISLSRNVLLRNKCPRRVTSITDNQCDRQTGRWASLEVQSEFERGQLGGERVSPSRDCTCSVPSWGVRRRLGGAASRTCGSGARPWSAPAGPRHPPAGPSAPPAPTASWARPARPPCSAAAPAGWPTPADPRPN